ncbi:LysR family transcriptional regulator [Zymobacter sp. IVIA_5232.4 C2]|uniref:LysR family transcriptional regulator n=1 Tax=Zymobacter sp. IVIA_5232.4 C2 TaxID=3394855 RepID=UPI0039C437FC
MSRENVNHLVSFIAVGRQRSFTKAAAQLGVSPSALSHTIRILEERIGLRLLTRTTRSVSLTEAGERLLRNIGPRFDEIETELAALNDLKNQPSGTIRVTASQNVAENILCPVIEKLLPEYPDINIEIAVDHGFTDIVAERYDAGIRLGEDIEKDMIAVRVGPDISMAVVAAPSYFAKHPRPETPRDLIEHNCISLRLKTYGGLYAWELSVRVQGQFTSNNPSIIKKAALAGLGIGYLSEEHVADDIKAGRLIRVLEEWCPSFPGFHLYYPSRRQPSPAFTIFVDALRYYQ